MTGPTSHGRLVGITALLALLALLAGCGGSTVATPTAPPSQPASTSGALPSTSTSTTAAVTPTEAAVASPSAAPASCVAVPQGIVAWWRAEDDATDAIGDADGALQGGGYAAGNVGRAFVFSGDKQEVEVANAPALQLRHALTIEGWVKEAAAPTTSYAGIAGTWDDTAGANRTYLFWALNGALDFVVSTDGGSYLRATDPTPLPVGEWAHVAGTYDGTTIRVYVDGVQVGQTPMTGELAVNSQPFAIGRTNGGSVGANYWNGSIDELAVYERALTPDEIAGIHAAGTAGKCTG